MIQCVFSANRSTHSNVICCQWQSYCHNFLHVIRFQWGIGAEQSHQWFLFYACHLTLVLVGHTFETSGHGLFTWFFVSHVLWASPKFNRIWNQMRCGKTTSWNLLVPTKKGWCWHWQFWKSLHEGKKKCPWPCKWYCQVGLVQWPLCKKTRLMLALLRLNLVWLWEAE